MASQTAVTKSKDNSSPIEIQKEHRQMVDRANDAVARRAYALFLAGGASDGQDLANWLQAESEILTRIPDIRESASWYTVNVPLQGFGPEQIQVSVDENSAIIAADKRQNANECSAHDSNSTQESVFLVANWPSSVDPSTASAYVKNEGLILTVKRSAAE
jgi:HSP20 family molecular chaperone IbpA